MKISLITLFLTTSAKQASARVIHSTINRENATEDERFILFDAFNFNSLSMPAAMAELSMPAVMAEFSMPAAMANESKLSKYLTINKHNGGGSKASKTACSFANPAIDQVFELDVASFETLVLHALAANYHFELALTDWRDKKITLDDVEDRGYALGTSHIQLFSQYDDTTALKKVCAMQTVLVTQMVNTCYYSSRKKSYETIAAALMTGFGDGVNLPDFDGCPK